MFALARARSEVVLPDVVDVKLVGEDAVLVGVIVPVEEGVHVLRLSSEDRVVSEIFLAQRPFSDICPRAGPLPREGTL